ncbi:hypothetical protein C8R46DRAFT_1042122 [Mycena filopes]|nr:hypothetical protein C8R46DRAFT_1042122 [Mycena filopes]
MSKDDETYTLRELECAYGEVAETHRIQRAQLEQWRRILLMARIRLCQMKTTLMMEPHMIVLGSSDSLAEVEAQIEGKLVQTADCLGQVEKELDLLRSVDIESGHTRAMSVVPGNRVRGVPLVHQSVFSWTCVATRGISEVWEYRTSAESRPAEKRRQESGGRNSGAAGHPGPGEQLRQRRRVLLELGVRTRRRPGGLERDTQGPGESLRRHKAMRGRGRRGNCAHQEGAWKEPDELLCEPDAAVAVAVDDVGAPVMRSPAVIGKGPGTHCDEIRRCGEGKLRAPMKVGDTLGRDTRCPYLRVKAAKASHQTDCWRKNEGMGAEVGHTDEARTSSLRACPARVRVTADGRSWGQPRRLVVGYTGITISGGQEGLKETLLVEAPTPSSRACQAPYVAVLQGRRLHCGATLSVEPNDLQKERNRRTETSTSTTSRFIDIRVWLRARFGRAGQGRVQMHAGWVIETTLDAERKLLTTDFAIQ